MFSDPVGYLCGVPRESLECGREGTVDGDVSVELPLTPSSSERDTCSTLRHFFPFDLNKLGNEEGIGRLTEKWAKKGRLKRKI